MQDSSLSIEHVLSLRSVDAIPDRIAVTVNIPA